eukprot:1366642-Amorphochlora_amoeboformis.AAC.1
MHSFEGITAPEYQKHRHHSPRRPAKENKSKEIYKTRDHRVKKNGIFDNIDMVNSMYDGLIFKTGWQKGKDEPFRVSNPETVNRHNLNCRLWREKEFLLGQPLPCIMVHTPAKSRIQCLRIIPPTPGFNF